MLPLEKLSSVGFQMEYLVMSICLMNPVPVINAFSPQIFSVEIAFSGLQLLFKSSKCLVDTKKQSNTILKI